MGEMGRKRTGEFGVADGKKQTFAREIIGGKQLRMSTSAGGQAI
jgi:hypothetical protein